MKKVNLKRISKYFLYTLLVAGVFTSCINDTGANGDKVPLGNRTIQIIDFDGCEYVYLRRYGSVTITHKGNCKNTIHACH